MKKTGFWMGFSVGLAVMLLVLVLCMTAMATTRRTIEVEDGIAISMNGAAFVPRDAKGNQVPVFLYSGTTYVPVRAITEAMGMSVAFDSATRTVLLTTADRLAAQHSDAGSYIAPERAREIALQHAGVRAANAVFLKVSLNWDGGRAEYEVEFYSGSTEYDYDIDAVTGAILSVDWDLDDFVVSRPAAGGTLSPSSSYISEERAREIALQDAGIRSEDAVFLKVHLDRDGGRAEYEVEFYSGSTEYDYDIDAITGAILSVDRELDSGHHTAVAAGGASGGTITASRAQEIALAEVPGARVVKCELDRDDGRLIYEVELRSGSVEYEFEIDAQTGSILSRDTDYD